MFKLETNKDIVIKTLKKMIVNKNNKSNTKSLENVDMLKVDFKNINQTVLKDIDVIKATRPD
jgi:hypothetical protein